MGGEVFQTMRTVCARACAGSYCTINQCWNDADGTRVKKKKWFKINLEREKGGGRTTLVELRGHIKDLALYSKSDGRSLNSRGEVWSNLCFEKSLRKKDEARIDKRDFLVMWYVMKTCDEDSLAYTPSFLFMAE